MTHASDPLLFELEVRGYLPFVLPPALAPHVGTAVTGSGSLGAPHDLVLVVDRTRGDATEGAAPAGPHRTSARMPPFALPVEEVVAIAERLPRSFFAPLRRITIVEIADHPPSPADLDRIATYTSPARGEVLLGAVYVDTSGPAVHSNDGASPYATGLQKSHDIADIARRAFGAGRVEAEPLESVALFGARPIGLIGFFLSPFAAAALVGWNFYRTRRAKLAAALVVPALAVFVAVGVVAALVPAGAVLQIGANLGALFAIAGFAQAQFGKPIRAASVALGIGLGLVAFLVLGGALGVAQIALVPDEP